MKVEVAGLLMS